MGKGCDYKRRNFRCVACNCLLDEEQVYTEAIGNSVDRDYAVSETLDCMCYECLRKSQVEMVMEDEKYFKRERDTYPSEERTYPSERDLNNLNLLFGV